MKSKDRQNVAKRNNALSSQEIWEVKEAKWAVKEAEAKEAMGKRKEIQMK